jgi:Secretion system C-terminal sorting domain
MIFPNPVHDLLHIKSTVPHPSIIWIWNEYGSMVLEKYIESDELNTCVDITNLHKGVYFIQVKTERGMNKYHRVVKL